MSMFSHPSLSVHNISPSHPLQASKRAVVISQKANKFLGNGLKIADHVTIARILFSHFSPKSNDIVGG